MALEVGDRHWVETLFFQVICKFARHAVNPAAI
ncbi:MAG: hypothetical protein ALAOOOJD_00183 [bacterium]|nr:hypothetical protein [bacterium]